MVFSLNTLHQFIAKTVKKRLIKFSGRNFLGRICVFHQGGSSLHLYRPIDFYRRINAFGRVIRISKDFFRSAFVASVLYTNGLISSILAVEGQGLGHLFFSGSFFATYSAALFAKGSAVPLRYVNLFSVVSSAELQPSQGSKFFRAGGTSSLFVAKDKFFGTLKCSSGWLLKIPLTALVTIGRSSNVGHKYQRIPNAGYQRRLGVRPTVRGVVKNPCDHPHGGGEGKGSPPAAQMSP